MKSNKINISINEKDNIKENNNINNNSFSNIKILKEYESNPATELKENSEKNTSKIKMRESFEVEYEEIPYKLNIILKWDNTINIELISKEGHIPYSYRCIYDEKKFYELDSIFVEINTIEKIYNKIINLFKKNRVSLIKDKMEDIFYLILNVTIIDEDRKIIIPLKINDNIQISTINYLLRESEFLKNDISENELKKIIQEENKELSSINNINEDYKNIINKIKEDINSRDDKEILNILTIEFLDRINIIDQ